MTRWQVPVILTSMFLVFFVSGVVLTGCNPAEKAYGKPIAETEETSISEIAKNPTQYHNKIVRLEGKVGEVCQQMGCWFYLSDGTGQIKIDLQMGMSYTIPKKSSGKLAVVEGRVQYDGSGPLEIIGVGTTFQ